MDGPVQKLMDELRSLLDETTILSISSDYNLENPKEFAQVRQILLTISQDVEAEEATGFNPSGLGDDAIDINPSNQDNDPDVVGTASSDIKSVGGLTTTTENSLRPSLVSTESSRASSRETPGLIHVNVFDGLSDGDKEHQLVTMFSSLKSIDVKRALRNSNGDASLAMDELLNLQWLEQTGLRPKGVDGFYVSDDDIPSKKKKGKKRKGSKAASPKATNSKRPLEDTKLSAAAHNDNITLISDRLNLAPSEVTSIYRQHECSSGATVEEILKNYISLNLESTDSHLQSEIQREATKISWVPPAYIKAAFEICSEPNDARDVIHILKDHFQKPKTTYVKYDVSYNVVASDADVIEAPSPHARATSPEQLPRISTNMRSSTFGSLQQVLNSPTNLQSAAVSSASLAESRRHSIAAASAANQKGRSNHLYRQVGAFYAERAREQTAGYWQASSLEANSHVDQQSTQSVIDLHGVTVQDGVEIALDRTWRWWQGLGEERTRKAKAEGLRVITGIGRHNANGLSPLRNGVCKALVNNGWKVEVMTGWFLITGRRKGQ